MARPTAATTGQLDALDERRQGFPFEDLPDGVIEVNDVTIGMASNLTRDKRPLGSSLSIVNGRSRENWVGRRGGYADYVTKPDSNLVLKIIGFNGTENDNWVVRVSVGGIHATATTTGWTALSGSAYSAFGRMTHAQMLFSLYLANPQKKIVKVDLEDLTFAEVSEAPICRYITPFADRLVAAYIHDSASGILPFGLAWSENADPLDWTGDGSGTENLIQNPSDTGDEITGLLGYGNVLIILRERSIWHAVRQPFQTAPMRFIPIITSQGCDMPYTAVRTVDENGKLTGIMFADKRTNGVFSYTPGSRPQRISRLIEDILFEDIADPAKAEGTFLSRYQEYHFGYSTDSSNPYNMSKYRVFSQETGAWVTDDSPTATTIGVVSDIGAPTVIDDLSGFIDDLSGVIDGLGGVVFQDPILLKCGTAGEVQDEDMATAASHTFTWTSQNIGAVSRRRLIKIFQLLMSASASGDTVLEFSKDASTWTNIKTISDPSSLSKIGSKRGFSGDDLYWRVTSKAKEFRFTEWWAKVLEKGLKQLT
ncbi:hypothetical protein LCGC14_1828430 [marine sediment metagenome]|uniref:Uncharacterized protein n=1 Tax=marine sediment metagenome TaxID=412755 RepID=A0A0F9H4Z8_9ZZZZ